MKSTWALIAIAIFAVSCTKGRRDHTPEVVDALGYYSHDEYSRFKSSFAFTGSFGSDPERAAIERYIAQGHPIPNRTLIDLVIRDHSLFDKTHRAGAQPADIFGRLNEVVASIAMKDQSDFSKIARLKRFLDQHLERSVGPFAFNRRANSIADRLFRNRGNAYSGTVLFDLLLRLRMGPSYPADRMVVIFENGHMLLGEMVDRGMGFELIGYETTAMGRAIKNYGQTQAINQSLRIVSTNDFLFAEAMGQGLKNTDFFIDQATQRIEQRYSYRHRPIPSTVPLPQISPPQIGPQIGPQTVPQMSPRPLQPDPMFGRQRDNIFFWGQSQLPDGDQLVQELDEIPPQMRLPLKPQDQQPPPPQRRGPRPQVQRDPLQPQHLPGPLVPGPILPAPLTPGPQAQQLDQPPVVPRPVESKVRPDSRVQNRPANDASDANDARSIGVHSILCAITVPLGELTPEPQIPHPHVQAGKLRPRQQLPRVQIVRLSGENSNFDYIDKAHEQSAACQQALENFLRSPRAEDFRSQRANPPKGPRYIILAPAGSGLQKPEIRDAIRTPLEPSSHVEILVEGTDF